MNEADPPNNGVWRRLRIPAMLLAVAVALGSLGFYLEWREYSVTWLDAIYMSFITVTTVGYSEVHPLSASGRVLAILVALGGIGALFYLLTTLMEALVRRQVRDPFGREKMQENIDRLENHVLVVGFGRMGQHAAAQLAEDDVAFVVVDVDESVADACRSSGYLHVIGNAEDDDVLVQAGVTRAKGVIVCTGSDAGNAFIVMTARAVADDVFIVVRADDAKTVRKLEQAGADRAVDLYTLGGQRLADSVVRPAAMRFFTETLREAGSNLMIDDVVVTEGGDLVERSLGELDLRQRVGASVVAVLRQDDSFPNPGPDFLLEPGDQLIVMGLSDQIRALREIAGH